MPCGTNGMRQFKRAQQRRLADNANRTYRLSRGQVTAVAEGTSKTTMSSLFKLAGSAERYELPFGYACGCRSARCRLFGE